MNILEAIEEVTAQTKRKISYTDIGKALSVSRQYINQIKKSELTKEQISSIENYFHISFTNKNENNFLDNCTALPVRGNLQASLGHGVEIIDEGSTGEYWINNRLLRQLGVSKQYTDFVPCEGDSMFPTIDGGCLLMVDKSQKEVFDGKIYCIRLNNNLIAKRLQFIPPHSIKVISDNKEKYDPFYIDLSKEIDFDFEIIGEVKWWGTIAK